MPKRITMTLSEAEVSALERMRDEHPKAYLRERAAALLKVAKGATVKQVAEQGLLQRHEPETVSEWIRRYQAHGIEGLKMKAGRGRKPAFFPSELVDSTSDPAASGTA